VHNTDKHTHACTTIHTHVYTYVSITMHAHTHNPLQSTRRVHNTFLALDEDMNSMLSISEFSQISSGTMSSLFFKVVTRWS